MFSIIKTKENVENFLDKTNALHDGYIISVQYTNGGVTKLDYGYHFNHEKTKLIIPILVQINNAKTAERQYMILNH